MYIGCVDIGGTSIKLGVLDLEGNINNPETIKLPKDFNDLKMTVKDYLDRTGLEIKGLAISAPGAVDTKSGIIGGVSAVPYIHGVDFKKEFKDLLGVNVSIENDANCAALAEICYGDAKVYKDMCFVVCGTGIGGAVVKDRHVHHGANLYGGEFGCMIMPKPDGTFSTFSTEASTMSFVNKMRKLCNDDTIDGLKVFEMAASGDARAIEAIEYFYNHLALGIFNVQHVFDPEVVLLGGAISNREDFASQIDKALDYWVSKFDFKVIKPKVMTCTFKKDANLVGALANYVQEYLE